MCQKCTSVNPGDQQRGKGGGSGVGPWARDWLDSRLGAPGAAAALTAEEPGSALWLQQFAVEVCDPRHRLLCPVAGVPALAPNRAGGSGRFNSGPKIELFEFLLSFVRFF